MTDNCQSVTTLCNLLSLKGGKHYSSTIAGIFILLSFTCMFYFEQIFVKKAEKRDEKIPIIILTRPMEDIQNSKGRVKHI